jgi:predicted metal-binding protein/ubiquinone/menaquinone biosynthesis C-methylase UbiE
MKLPHQQADIASEGFQSLEDLATSSWYSEVLFAALDLNIFGLLGDGPASVAELVEKSGYEADALSRFLAALMALGLITEHQGRFANGPLAARYLIPGKSDYWGDFLLYRRYLGSHWPRLTDRIRQGVSANDRPMAEPPEAYRERTLAYVRAMDLQARLKAAEALEYLGEFCQFRPKRILDLGGGAGAWCRAFRRQWPQVRTVLLDLPETLAAARQLYPDPESWEGIEAVAGNGLASCLRGEAFDLILLSNVIHAYGEFEAREILSQCVNCLAPGGRILIHDYLADLHGSDPAKGSLYDLHMLVNTYNGRIYHLAELEAMLTAAGLKNMRFFHLASDTSVLLAWPQESMGSGVVTQAEILAARAQALGFPFARIIETSEVVVEPWVRLKCRFGCSLYGQSLGCPPSSPDEEKMRAILSRYRLALLVQGAPPSTAFHEQLLALERSFFLAGYTEALAFGAGPCSVCPSCPADGRCRCPEKARPSLEACGVDVYETARRAGLSLHPVPHHQGYVKYVGLVLFDKEGSYADPAGPGDLNS